MHVARVVAIGLSISMVSSQAAGQPEGQAEQSSPRPQYQSLRYEEDWSTLRNPQQRTHLWDRVKYLPLNEDDWYVSLGGEGRLRYEALRNAAFGSGPQDANGYVLQRYLVHADLHAGRRVRFFTELQSGVETGRTGGPLPLTTTVSTQPAFAEIRAGSGPRLFTLGWGVRKSRSGPAD